jgi:hypothetical protein
MKRKLIFFTVAITIVALFAVGEVLAGDCGDNVLPGINIHFIGIEKQTDGTYEVTYDVSGNKVSNLTSVDLALPKNVNVVWMPSAYTWSDPGEGAQAGDGNWGEDFWEQRIISGTPQDVGDSKLFYFRVSNGGEATGGININATRGRTETCTTTVPSGFAQEAVISEKKVITEDGAEICLRVDPITQCEMAVDCDTGVELSYISVQEAFRIGDETSSNPVLYVAVPGEPCQTFTADDGIPGSTRYYCSGGKCYPY